MGDLAPDLERLLREVHEQEGGIHPVTLSKAYLDAVKEIEDLPCNRSGADKSWVLGIERRWRKAIKAARRVT